MTGRRLVLASTSKFRRDLLRRLGLPFKTAAPRWEEKTLPEPATPDQVRAVVLENARGKAESLRSAYPGALLLASDQLGECDGRILSKPKTVDNAVAQLLWLTGREHRLHTAVVLLDGRENRRQEAVLTNTLGMRPLSREALQAYVERERPLKAAGSYLSEGLGIALFDYLRGDDPTAVIGLPLTVVAQMLEAHGLSPFGISAKSGSGERDRSAELAGRGEGTGSKRTPESSEPGEPA